MKRKQNNVALLVLLEECCDLLGPMSMGYCECEEVGHRCVECLHTVIRAVLKHEEKEN